MLESQPATIEALVVGVEEPVLSNAIVDELRTLHAQKVLTVIDVIVVKRLPDGGVVAEGLTELSRDEGERAQAVAKEVLGVEVEAADSVAGIRWEGRSVLLGAEDVHFVAHLLAPGHAAIAVVFEHRWAARFGQLLHASGVRVLEDDVLTPDLIGKRGEGVSVW